MSADASVTLTWADGDHKFRLRMGQIRELQENCKAGMAEIIQRLRTERWWFDDVREPIRLGLIGGGMKPTDALKLVQRYVDDRPLMENVLVATTVMFAAVVGVESDPVGKAEPGETETGPTTTGGSSSPASTGLEPSSGSPHGKLMN